MFAVQSHYSEVFANLPMTLAALSDDVANDMAQRWFLSSELKSLNVTEPVDFVFLGELYMMQEIINVVCFIVISFGHIDTDERPMRWPESFHCLLPILML